MASGSGFAEDPKTYHFDLENHLGSYIQPGENKSIHSDYKETTQKSLPGQLLDGGFWAPYLVGDYTLQSQAPSTTYFIQIHPSPTRDFFILTVGAATINQKGTFTPKGYIAGTYREAVHKGLAEMNQVGLYVSSVYYGGQKTHELKFETRTKGQKLPAAKTHRMQIRGSTDDDTFRRKLAGLLSIYFKEYRLNGSYHSKTENPGKIDRLLEDLGADANTSKEKTKPTFKEKFAKFKSHFKKNKGMTPEEYWQTRADLLVDPMTAYVKTFLNSGTPGASQKVEATAHPFNQGLSYTEVDRDTFTEVLPELGPVAKQLSLEVFEAKDAASGKIICHIQVYPNPREADIRVSYRTDVTWKTATGEADTLAESLKQAWQDLEKKLQK